MHSDTCQHKNGVGHDSKTDVGCADDLYVVRLVLHLPHFASQVTQTDPTQSNCAMVEVFGVPTRSTTMALNAEFSTEYKTESWNRNTSTRTIDGDYAKMMPLTAEPELQTYFNWTGGKTNEDNYEVDAATHRPKSANKVIHETLPQTITNVPYRWGEGSYAQFNEGKPLTSGQVHGTSVFSDDNPQEDAWYEYILTNKSKSTAENSYLDLAVNGVSYMKTSVDGNGVSKYDANGLISEARGFIADTLQIDGYFRYKNGDNRRTKLPADTTETDTSWYNRAGNIATLWLYDCETAVPHTQETYTKNTAGQVTSTTSVDGTTGDVVTVNASGVDPVNGKVPHKSP